MNFRKCALRIASASAALLTFFVVSVVSVSQETPDRSAAASRSLERRIRNTVLETGILESGENVVIRCPLRSSSAVLSLVPAGSIVKKGDLLIVLDDSVLRDQHVKQEIVLAHLEAKTKQAQSAVKGTERQGESLLEAAQLELKAAQRAYDSYFSKDGEYEKQLRDLEGKIGLSQKSLNFVQNELTLIREQTRLGRSDASDVHEAGLHVETAKFELGSLQREKSLLEKHIRPRQQAILKSAVARSNAQLIEQQARFATEIMKRETDLAAIHKERKLELQELKELQDEIARCNIHAPQDGMVVYATSASRRGGDASIEEGATVRPRQPLLQIPNMRRLQVRVLVHESKVSRVKPGQRVKLRFDAFPGREHLGKVARVSNQPEPTSWVSANVKEYAVYVTLDDSAADLRLGLTAEAEIMVSSMK